MPFHYRCLLVFFVTLIFSVRSAAQCSGCTTHISGYDTLVYTVDTGQVFCVDSMGDFEGTITLNGGRICIDGVFYPKNFAIISGTITNNCIIIQDSTFTISQNLILIDGPNSQVAVRHGDFIVNGGVYNNAGVTSVQHGDVIFNGGTFINSAIITCRTLLGTAVNSIISNGGIISRDY